MSGNCVNSQKSIAYLLHQISCLADVKRRGSLGVQTGYLTLRCYRTDIDGTPKSIDLQSLCIYIKK